MKPSYLLAAVAGLALSSSGAVAQTKFDFKATSAVPTDSFSFTLPDNFTIIDYKDYYFQTGQYSANSNSGFGPITYDDHFVFYTADGGGGFDDDFSVHTGPELFSGTTTAPTFLLGTFTMGDGTLTITRDAVTSAVPEPATWAMMLGGFGLVGGAMRYRRRQTRISYATA